MSSSLLPYSIPRWRVPSGGHRLVFYAAHAALSPVGVALSLARRPPLREVIGNARSMLILRQDGIGDVILSTPVLYRLRKTRPDLRITMAIASWSEGLRPFIPWVDEFVTFDDRWFVKTESFSNTLRFAAAMRARKFDVVCDLRGDPRNIFLTLALGGASTVGYESRGCGFLLDYCVRDAGGHYVELHHDLCSGMGLAGGFQAPILERPSRATRHRCVRPLIVVHPGSRTPLKAWPVDRYGELCRALLDRHGGTVVLLGTKDESPAADRIRAFEPRIESLVGRTTLSGMLEVVADADLYVGPDSAGLNAAGAFGVPAVGLFGPTSPKNTGVYSTTARKLHGGSDFPCSPCDQKRCVRPEDPCIGRIEAVQVLEECDRLFGVRS